MVYYISLLIFSCAVFAKDTFSSKTMTFDRRAADSGTKAITGSMYGTTATFTRRALASITTNNAADVQVQTADPLVSVMSSFASNGATYTSKPALKHGSFLSSPEKRNPPSRTNRLVSDDCTTRRVNSIIDQRRPGGPLNGIIGPPRAGSVIDKGVDEDVDGAMEAFYFRAQTIAEVAWVPQEMLRNVLDKLVEMVSRVQVNLQAIGLFIYANTLFRADRRRSSRCDVGDKAPLCSDITCRGDDDLRCTRDPIKGCKCIRTMDIVVDNFCHTAWVDIQQNVLDGLGFPEGPPLAGARSTYNGDDPVRWTTQDAVTKALSLFRGDPDNLKSNPGRANAQHLQHGGAMITCNNLILPTDPQGVEVESKCYGLSTKMWVDVTDLEDGQQQFCSTKIHTIE